MLAAAAELLAAKAAAVLAQPQAGLHQSPAATSCAASAAWARPAALRTDPAAAQAMPHEGSPPELVSKPCQGHDQQPWEGGRGCVPTEGAGGRGSHPRDAA